MNLTTRGPLFLLASAMLGTLLLACGSTATQASSAFSAPFPYRLNGGVAGRHFWIDPGMINPAYAGITRDAMASWNGIGRVTFSETTSRCCDSQIDAFATAYGDKPWYGITEFYATGGAWLQATEGAEPFANWDYAQIGLNDTYLRDPQVFSTTQKVQAIAAHEIGHAIGLAHEDAANRCQLMEEFLVSSWSSCGVIYTPRAYDRQWAQQLP